MTSQEVSYDSYCSVNEPLSHRVSDIRGLKGCYRKASRVIVIVYWSTVVNGLQVLRARRTTHEQPATKLTNQPVGRLRVGNHVPN